MARMIELDTADFLAVCEPPAPSVTIEQFVASVSEANRKHYETHYPRLYAEPGYVKPVTMERGPKYTRVVDNTGGRSVLMFIENATGNILKAAGWKAPAKGVRGNIATTIPQAGTGWLYR